jgi:hypothetical protein
VIRQIFLHLLIWFKNVYRENDHALTVKFLGDVVDQSRLLFAILAPRGPELEKNDFTLDRSVVELIPSGGLGTETWGRLSGLVACEGARACDHECER